MRNVKERIHEYIEAHEEEMIRDLASLVAVPSIRGEAKPDAPFGEGPAEALRKMVEICEGYGFCTKNHENYIGTADLRENEEPALGLLCHLDVVPVGEGWHSDPFTMIREGNHLIGRGTADDKGPAVAALYAMRAVKELGLPLKKNVRFLFGTDEECGSGDLRYYTAKEKLPPMVFTPDAEYPLINLEKGIVHGDVTCEVKAGGEKSILSAKGGEVVNAVPGKAVALLSGFEKAEVEEALAGLKTDCTFSYENGTLTAMGKCAHASTPAEGQNAVTALLAALGRLKTTDETGDLFARASGAFVNGERNGRALGLDIRDEKSGALSFVFSMLSYSEGKFAGRFDIRFPICQTVAGVRALMEEGLSRYALTLASFDGVEPHYVDEKSPLVSTLLRTYTQVTGLRGYPVAIGGGTYVHGTEGGVAFGCAFPGEDNRMHGADEFMTLGGMKISAEIFANAICELCR